MTLGTTIVCDNPWDREGVGDFDSKTFGNASGVGVPSFGVACLPRSPIAFTKKLSNGDVFPSNASFAYAKPDSPSGKAIVTVLVPAAVVPVIVIK
jgi:hypothetical protein